MNNIISQNQEKIKNTQRYIPHLLEPRFHAVKTYRNGNSVSYVCRRYKISKASLMHWNKKFDGSIDSLRDKSHRPLSKHPKSHTDKEIYWIKNYIRRNPNITMIELFAKLKINKGYDRHPCSLFRILRKLGFFKQQQKVIKPYVPKPYDTPSMLGVKMQMDVKYVPKNCYVGIYPDKFYQYTMIDEAY